MTKSINHLVSFACASLALLIVVVIGCSQPPEPTPAPTPTPTPIPEATFSVSAESVMAPMEVGFSVEGPSADASYTWTFGDGNSATGATVSHTYLDIGQFTAVLSAEYSGTLVTAERSIQVQPGVAGWITLNAESVELESGQTFQFEVEAFDELGNPVDGSAVEWSTDPAAGTISTEGVFIGGPDIGSWDAGVIATFERGGSKVVTEIAVEIVYGEPSVLMIEPATIDTRVTWEVDLQATLFDDAGHEIQDFEVDWEALRPGDSISTSGEYIPSAEVASPDSPLIIARVEVGDKLLTEIVNGEVSPGILDEIQLTPAFSPLTPGESVQLSANGYDRFGNELVLDSVTWTLAFDVIGTVTADGKLTAGTVAGRFGDETLEVRGFKDGIESVSYVAVEILPDKPASLEFRSPDDSVPAGAASPIQLDVKDQYGNEITDAEVQFTVWGGGYLAVSDVFVAGLDPGVHVNAISAKLAGSEGESNGVQEASTSVVIRERSSDFLAIDVEDVQGSTVYMINLITAQMVPVSRDYLRDSGRESMPAWMPDGTRLLLTSNITGESQIYVVDPFHNIKHQITAVSGGALMAAPSPRGDKLAFVRADNDAGGWDVVVASMEFNNAGVPIGVISLEDLEVISSDATRRNILPQWSPSGEWLMYTAVDDRNSANVYIVDADSPDAESGFEIRGASGLSWHPEGEEVLITSTRFTSSGNVSSVPFMLNLTSGITRELDVGGMGVSVASFSPDGTELAFVDEDTSALWLMDSDGTGLRQAVGAQFQTTITSWRPRQLELPTDETRIHPYPGEIISRSEITIALQDAEPVALIETDSGDITVELFAQVAPKAVANFVYLALNGYYDGLAFHTVSDAAAFTGSVTDGMGGMAGYYITSELNPNALHDRPGVLSMVASRAGAVSSEFVISLAPNPEWDAFADGQPRNCDTFGSECYVVFGRVVEGLDLLSAWDPITPFDVGSTPHRIVGVSVRTAIGELAGTRQ